MIRDFVVGFGFASAAVLFIMVIQRPFVIMALLTRIRLAI
jgi:hypothetical protein